MRLTRSVRGDVLTLRFEGGLNALTAPSVAPAIDSAVNDGHRVVVADLSDLTEVDSSGVAAVVSLYKRLRNGGRTLRVVGVREQPAQIFELLGLLRMLSG